MDKITVGVLTVSDRCFSREATDESGPNLVSLIEKGIIKNGEVVKTDLVPDEMPLIKGTLERWCKDGIDLILTTGGTGISERDTTPEATLALLGKLVPGIQHLILKRGLELTSFAALSRGVACVVEKSLIINLPGSTKGAQECLEAAAEVIPHAVDLIKGSKTKIERVHASGETKRSSVVVGDVVRRKRESPYKCVSVTEAQNIIMDRINLLKRSEVVEWDNAHDHVLAEDVVARDYLPACDVSLLDGYAVLSSDPELVKKVTVISTAGGLPCDMKILPGQCARVNTGAAIPPGADAVVPVEKTEVKEVTEDGKEEKSISVMEIPAKGFGIRSKGTDHALGQLILKSGTYLDSSAVGLLAAAGITHVRVLGKPLLGVLSTGNELVEPHERLTPGKVRDSNRTTLKSLLKDEGFSTVDLGICADEPDALRDSLEKGFQKAEVVVTTGSMSMGELDYLKEVLVCDFNAEICFGRVLMKPGKPTSFAVLMFEGKPKVWFGLPGNPSSAYVTSHLFLLPALRNVCGRQRVYPLVVKTMLEKVPFPEDRPHYVRGEIWYNQYTNKWHTKLTGDQVSSKIGNCVNANCLVLIPKASDVQKQETSSDCEGKGLKNSSVELLSGSWTKSSSQSGNNFRALCDVASASSSPAFSFGFSPNFGNPPPKTSSANTLAPPLLPEFKALLIGKGFFSVNNCLEN